MHLAAIDWPPVGQLPHLHGMLTLKPITRPGAAAMIQLPGEQNVVEGTESDKEEMLGDVTNISDDYDNTVAEQELTEEEFEITDEQVGNSTPEDSFVGKYLTEIQNRLKGGVTPIIYQRKTYWVYVKYEGSDYNTRISLSK
ncbi:hypothetical protein INT47_003198 [Mucor saturninus]|uniref:Uncharacterized protein n=1 Tax=Mucor saturninus TaxID=64648 RepID=A0A8H7QE70_9FUNG|nr:hypothetical protein INT47_003198 [Mucor saturninus]